jgi:hypothetical protein
MPINGGGSADSDGYTAPVPPISCDFGPFGEQTQVNLETLGTQKLCKLPLPGVIYSPLLRPISFYPILIDTAIVALTRSPVLAGKPRPCIQRWCVSLGARLVSCLSR